MKSAACHRHLPVEKSSLPFSTAFFYWLTSTIALLLTTAFLLLVDVDQALGQRPMLVNAVNVVNIHFYSALHHAREKTMCSIFRYSCTL